jgi:hypothetical protein
MGTNRKSTPKRTVAAATANPMPAVLLAAQRAADVVTLPARTVVSLEGEGAPGQEQFQRSIRALYGVAYALKFARKRQRRGDFKLGPLEACWWADDSGAAFLTIPRESWRWRLRLAVPEEVAASEVSAAIAAAVGRKGGKLEGSPEAARVALERIAPSTCGRALHVGPYAEEAVSFSRIRNALEREGRAAGEGHVEIYLNDPRRTKPENLKTVLLLEVAKRRRSSMVARRMPAKTRATQRCTLRPEVAGARRSVDCITGGRPTTSTPSDTGDYGWST